jgi:CRISPR-associated protein Cas5 subtype I-B
MAPFRREDFEGLGYGQLRQVEKAFRLVQLLEEINNHAFLRERLALKGGTALNIVLWDAPRLSVDIDFNYIGSTDKETMLREQKEIDAALQSIFRSLRYDFEVQRKYANWTYSLQYVPFNAKTPEESLEVEINYILRVALFPIQQTPAKRLFPSLIVSSLRLLSTEEIAAAKFSALLSRAIPRDLFDSYQLVLRSDRLDLRSLRAGFVFYRCLQEEGFAESSVEAIDSIADSEVRGAIGQLLRRDVQFDILHAKRVVKDFLSSLLTLSEREQMFVDNLSRKKYTPELLFEGGQNLQQIRQHPRVQWMLRGKESRLAIKLQLIGCLNSFRVPDFHTYHKTLLFPPKTTVCGMIGAALGYSPQDVNDKLLPNLKIAVLIDAVHGEAKDLWKIKKVTNYSKGDENMEDCVVVGNKSYYGAVLLRELLYQPEYTVYVYSEDTNLLNEIFEALQNPEWALSLGREDELVKLRTKPEWIEVEEELEQWFIDTVLPLDVNKEKYDLDPKSIEAKGRARRIVPPMIYKLPMAFDYDEDGERSGIQSQPFTAIIGMKIRPKENSSGWVDGERAFQFF